MKLRKENTRLREPKKSGTVPCVSTTRQEDARTGITVSTNANMRNNFVKADQAIGAAIEKGVDLENTEEKEAERETGHTNSTKKETEKATDPEAEVTGTGGIVAIMTTTTTMTHITKNRTEAVQSQAKKKPKGTQEA